METSRVTKYVLAVETSLAKIGHATNAAIWHDVRTQFPDVSITTIHRVTNRLAQQGRIGTAPRTHDGHERYDTNSHSHHHFHCSKCDRLCDAPVTTEVNKTIESLKTIVPDCALAGSITMSGICQACQRQASL